MISFEIKDLIFLRKNIKAYNNKFYIYNAKFCVNLFMAYGWSKYIYINIYIIFFFCFVLTKWLERLIRAKMYSNNLNLFIFRNINILEMHQPIPYKSIVCVILITYICCSQTRKKTYSISWIGINNFLIELKEQQVQVNY